YVAELGFADARGILQHRAEYRFELAGRARDDTQHLRRRGLLRQGLAQLVEQPRVLDGDACLAGEAREQFDLLVGERADLLAIDAEVPDLLVIPEERHRDMRARARQRDEGGACVTFICREVGRAPDPPPFHAAPHDPRNDRIAPPQFFERPRRAVYGGHAELVAVEQRQRAKLGFAEAGRVFQDGSKHRLELAGRARNDTQHVRRRGLLLQRLAQLAEQPRVLDGDHGLGGEARDQLDLLCGEGTDLLAIDAY